MVKPNLKSITCSTLTGLATVLMACSSAWAYKVEKICEDIPATAKEPAQKKCKVVRVKESVPAKGDAKAEPKKDAKSGGH
jgi:hypothetical protein